ncbi:hypothetical protein AK812_SmicGene484 [Symbiodinium microadriaticum]|uniref:Uncharacterized protein n=1 Tax=Symbiodinium microadriaticum TaxID=2951 RepID=A0A1Q9F6K3_SYMMI|nr:hypothetical protein AK812_SmicGene484 [Symbiodinium microadriaticum]CAE7905740.1 unnamed protein product [Symbiodinium microadriaticum]CAE7944683.1 unnamed protein product [Symbiodinium sp. KB8]
MPHAKSRTFKRSERDGGRKLEHQPAPCTASVRHETVCPHGFAPLPSMRHFATTHHSSEPSIARERLLTSCSTLRLLDARTSPTAKGKPPVQEFAHSLPYELDVEFTLPRWLIPDQSTRVFFVALDMNLIKKHNLSPLSVWKGASIAERFMCVRPIERLDLKKAQQTLHGIPVKPCVLSGGKARILMLVVEQPKYIKPPEWSLLGLLSVALDRSPLQLSCVMQHSELPFDDAIVCGQLTLEAPTVPSTPGALHRVPLRIVCMLDTSASMSKHQSPVQTALCDMLQWLAPQDQLGIVASSSDTGGVVLELTHMDDEGKQRVVEALAAVQTGEHADVTRGLALALQCMENTSEGPEASAVSAIVLLACGGDALLQDHMDFLLDRCAAVPCSLYTFALASDESMDALPELSLRSKTPFTFLEQAPLLQEALARLVGLLSSVVAQQVEVVLKPRFEVEDILTPFDCYCSGSDPLTWHVKIPDLSVGERRDILVKLAVPATAPMKDGSITLLEASVSSQGYVMAEQSTSLRRNLSGLTAFEAPTENLEVRDHLERLEAGRVLEEAVFDADHFAFEAARGHLQSKRREYGAMVPRTPMLDLLDQELQFADQHLEHLHAGEDWKSCRPRLFEAILMHRLQRSVLSTALAVVQA